MNNLEQKIIKPKLGVLELAKQLGSVSQACKTMGYSRDSFYRFKRLYENGGEEALREISKRKPVIKNRVPEHVERAVVELAVENPALGQLRASQELLQRGIVVSSGGVRSIWIRNELETMKKRLKALEARSAQEGSLLTEEQTFMQQQKQEEVQGSKGLLKMLVSKRAKVIEKLGFRNPTEFVVDKHVPAPFLPGNFFHVAAQQAAQGSIRS